MNDRDEYLNMKLLGYKIQHQQQSKELNKMPKGRLGIRKEKGTQRYTQIITEQRGLDKAGKTTTVNIEENIGVGAKPNKYIRKTITENEELIRALARKKYLEISNALLSEEINRLENFIAKHIEPTPALILSMLPKAYKELPESMFFLKEADAQTWSTENYHKNEYKPQEKIHITSRGLRVRSKSELVISERLYANNVPFRYEQMIYIENHSFSPDFTFNLDGESYYWEHCGMMNDRRYRSSNKWKLSMYEKANIVPWKNLIITYDMADGGVNTAVIESEIVNKLCKHSHNK